MYSNTYLVMKTMSLYECHVRVEERSGEGGGRGEEQESKNTVMFPIAHTDIRRRNKGQTYLRRHELEVESETTSSRHTADLRRIDERHIDIISL